MGKKDTLLKYTIVFVYIVMILFNIISFFLSLNGRTTVEIAAIYPNLFTPSAYTYSIWGIIYVLLAFYVLFQLELFRKENNKIEEELLYQSRLIFMVIGILNIGWIIAWHFDYLALALMLTAITLIGLKTFCKTIRTDYMSVKDKLLIKLPFSIYYAWITVVIFSNAVILLVSIRFQGFGIAKELWVTAVLATLTWITAFRTIRNRDIAYGLTAIWAYTGILVKQLSEKELAGQYPIIIIATMIGMIILLTAIGYLLIRLRKRT